MLRYAQEHISKAEFSTLIHKIIVSLIIKSWMLNELLTKTYCKFELVV